MPGTTLERLLKLSPAERAELALTLWESLTDDERDSFLLLRPEQRAELDRRWAEHLENPQSAVSWQDVRRKLREDA